MVFPQYNEYHINLSYIIQMLAYYIYYINPKSQARKAIIKFLKIIKSTKLISSYELMFNTDIKLCDVKITVNERDFEFRFDLTKDISCGLTLIQDDSIYFLNPTSIGYRYVR